MFSKTTAALLVATLLTVGAGFLIKKPCAVGGAWGDRLEYQKLCYNDIQALYGVRKLDQRAFPYVVEKSYEYPVVMGLLMWATSLFAESYEEYFLANLPPLSLAALLVTLGLIGAIGPRLRILWFAAGPPLAFYAFLNFDLYAAAALALAMWAWARGAFFWSGVAVGVGICAKIYPGFVLPALAIALWHREGRLWPNASLLRLGSGALGAFLVINLPVLFADVWVDGAPDGWLGMFGFHARRLPDFGTIWHWFPRIIPGLPASNSWFYRDWVDRITLLLFVGGTLGLLWAQWRRRLDPWVVGGSIVALYLLIGKIHSPQHTLWMVPFLVATSVHPVIILTYYLADAGVFIGGFWWIAETPSMSPGIWQKVFSASVFLRAGALLAFILWTSSRGRDLLLKK